MSKKPTKAQAEVITLLESSPGGITSSEIAVITAKYSISNIYSFMRAISAWSIYWEQKDEENEIWFHSIKFDHLYTDRDFRPAMPQKTRKRPMNIRPSLENPGDYAYTKFDRVMVDQIKMVAADNGESIIDWLSCAIEAKIKKGAPEKSPEIKWKYTTTASIRLPRDLVRRVKKLLIGTEITIGEFCREAAKERIG